jgi:hypothetical protein
MDTNMSNEIHVLNDKPLTLTLKSNRDLLQARVKPKTLFLKV